jgi:hypothetical protein
MDDALGVRVRQCLEDLGSGLHGRRIVDAANSKTLTQGVSRDIGIGDVDVPVVPLEGERAEAARMAQPGRRLHLALRARPGLAFTGDDLERDVASEALVPHEPHRPGTAGAEWAEGPVAAEDEILLVEGGGVLDGTPGLFVLAANSCNRRSGW